MLMLSRLAAPASSYTTLPAPIATWDGFGDGDFMLSVKGAPEILLPRCTAALDPDGGKPVNLTPEIRQRITTVQERWAADGRRVLLLARKAVSAHDIPDKADPNSEEFEQLVEDLNHDLIIVGLVGLTDPLKPDIVETVRICRGAGIRFFVVTGVSQSLHMLTKVLMQPNRRSPCNFRRHRWPSWYHYRRWSR
jgi:sodium/potassium-transporting ATPase subunit alpha